MPLEIYYDGKKVGDFESTPSTKTIESNIFIFYGGDEFRGYAVQEDSVPVDSGRIEENHSIHLTVHLRNVPAIEAGQPATWIGKDLELRHVKL